MLIGRNILLASIVTAGFMLTACVAKVADKQQYSGFLPDYTKLHASKSASGHPVLRWVAADYQPAKYHGILSTPVVYYPTAKPNVRISQQTLERVRSYTDQQLKTAVSRHSPLVTRAVPGTLILKTAITAVTAENEGVKFYEVVPVAAVIASTMAASGHRTQNSVLFLEAQLIDAQTGKTVVEVVRKGFGKNVANSSTPVTFADLQPAIDEMINDVVNFSVNE